MTKKKPEKEEAFCLHAHKWVELDGGHCQYEDWCLEERGLKFLPCPWDIIVKLQRQETIQQ